MQLIGIHKYVYRVKLNDFWRTFQNFYFTFHFERIPDVFKYRVCNYLS